jgi:hypothetical protein
MFKPKNSTQTSQVGYLDIKSLQHPATTAARSRLSASFITQSQMEHLVVHLATISSGHAASLIQS